VYKKHVKMTLKWIHKQHSNQTSI